MTKGRMRYLCQSALLLVAMVVCVCFVGVTAFAEELQKVAAPVISPGHETHFYNELTISIGCGTENAVIHYTVDGSDPTAESPVYNGGFRITDTTLVRALAICDGYENSDIVRAVFIRNKDTGGSGGGGYSGYGATHGVHGVVAHERQPRYEGESASWAEIAFLISQLEHGSEVNISLNECTDVPEEVMQAIADVDAKVNFKVDSSKDWYLDGADIITPMSADLSVTEADIEVELSDGAVGAKLSIGGTNHPTKLSIRFDREYAGDFANLYRAVDGKLIFVDCIKLDAKGNAKLLEISDAGDYVILMGQYSMLLHDVNNDGDIDTEDVTALLYDIVQLQPAANPNMRDVTENGMINAHDAAALLAFLSTVLT